MHFNKVTRGTTVLSVVSNVERDGERAMKGEKKGLEEESTIILEERGKMMKKDTQFL